MNTQNVLNLMESGRTLRYHTHARVMRCPQDVGQHTYNVFWLLYALSNGTAPAAVMARAMAHDAAERWTGDLPGDVKRELDLGPLFDKMEQEIEGSKLGLGLAPVDPAWARLIKLCDALEGLVHCALEIKLGGAAAFGVVFDNFSSFVRVADARMTSSDRAETSFQAALFESIVSNLNFVRRTYA